jgi:hypothetical protein
MPFAVFRPNGKTSMATALLAACLTALGCGDGITPADPPHVAQVRLSLTTLELDVGETVVIQAVLTDQFSESYPVADAALSWSSDDPQIATISVDAGTCVVAGVGAGSTVIRASVGGLIATAIVNVNPSEPPEPDKVTIEVENALIEPISVEINGVPRLTVPSKATRKASASPGEPVQVSWSLVRPTDAHGEPLGEAIGETFPLVLDPQRTLSYRADARIGDHAYFAPLVRNETESDLLIGVNMGLPSEDRCGYTVLAGSTASLGYYRLVPESNVRAYLGSTYTHAHVSWEILPEHVDRVSGRIELTAAFGPGPSG